MGIMAARSGKSRIVEILIKADPLKGHLNIKGYDGKTALGHALRSSTLCGVRSAGASRGVGLRSALLFFGMRGRSERQHLPPPKDTKRGYDHILFYIPSIVCAERHEEHRPLNID